MQALDRAINLLRRRASQLSREIHGESNMSKAKRRARAQEVAETISLLRKIKATAHSESS